MKLDELIEEGKSIEKYNVKYQVGNGFEGQEYETWKAKALIYIENEKNYENMEIVKKFISASKKNDMKSYNEMMGVLLAIQEDYKENAMSKEDILAIFDDEKQKQKNI